MAHCNSSGDEQLRFSFQGKLSAVPFEYFRFGNLVQVKMSHFKSIRDLTLTMFSTTPCMQRSNMGGLFTSRCITVLPSSPAFLLFLLWLKIGLDYFNTFSLYPIGSQFQVERITLVNTFPFGAKLPSHSPLKKGAMIRKLCQANYLTSPLTSHSTLSAPFSPCFLTTIPTQTNSR